MGYGVTGESGIAGRMVAGPRYAGQALKIPRNMGFTGSAEGGTIRQLYGRYQRIPYKVFGSIPMWQIEGQQVDPFYDVRSSGLGFMRVVNRPEGQGDDLRIMRPWRQYTFGGKGTPAAAAAAAELEAGAGGDVFDFGRMVVPLVAGVVLFYMMGRKGKR